MIPCRLAAHDSIALPGARAKTACHPDSAGHMSTNIVPLNDAASRPIPVAALTARMKAGEEAAFLLFHELYCDRLFRYLIVLSRGDEELARDLLQTTLLKVVRSIRHFPDETEFWNWLAAIARNNFFDHLRRTRRMPQVDILSPEQTANLAALEPYPENSFLEQALDRALAGLPEQERALIDSFYFQTGTYRSIALQRDTTPKAVESHLARIRQKLRNTILNLLKYENA
jgi:RNA polymerase sigma-70 factor (ECF subfamily)